MRQLLSRVALGLRIGAFTLQILVGWPLILFHFGVSWLRERIESRWPDNARAHAISFWIGLLAPILLNILLLIGLWIAALHLRTRGRR